MSLPQLDRMLNGKSTADFLQVSWKTLARWRSEGGGPPYLRLSRTSIRYRMSDLVEWLKKLERTSTSDSGDAK